MDMTSICRAGLFLLLAALLLTAGCSESSDVPSVPATGTGPRYTSGDIVRNPSAAAGTAVLVTGFDARSDTYERAVVLQKADGTWYRPDNRTEKTARTLLEKVYTERIVTLPVSSVPLVTPPVVTTVTTSPTTLPATAVTPAAPPAPSIRGIIPDEGIAGRNVSVRNLAGEHFVVGATVSLSRNASTIMATDVRYISNKSLICTLVIPADAPAGSWDVTVTNPDGRKDTFTNIFTVRRDPGATVTVEPVSSGTVPLTSIDPSFGYSRDYREFVIQGSKFQAGATVALQREGKPDIAGTAVRVMSDTRIQCFFDIPYESMGTWDIVVTNPDETSGRWVNGFEVRR